jgi:hypothetical protein
MKMEEKKSTSSARNFPVYREVMLRKVAGNIRVAIENLLFSLEFHMRYRKTSQSTTTGHRRGTAGKRPSHCCMTPAYESRMPS